MIEHGALDLKAASREQLEAAETQYRAAQLSVSTAQAEESIRAEFHLTEFLDVPLSDKTPSGTEVTDADRVPIKSPAAGTVMERVANVGTVVSIGDPVVTVSDLSSLWLIAAINEAELSHIRVGQPVRISVRAYPDRVFPGKVFQLGERMDPQTRTLQVRVLVSNSGRYEARHVRYRRTGFSRAEIFYFCSRFCCSGTKQPGRPVVFVHQGR